MPLLLRLYCSLFCEPDASIMACLFAAKRLPVRLWKCELAPSSSFIKNLSAVYRPPKLAVWALLNLFDDSSDLIPSCTPCPETYEPRLWRVLK